MDTLDSIHGTSNGNFTEKFFGMGSNRKFWSSFGLKGEGLIWEEKHFFNNNTVLYESSLAWKYFSQVQLSAFETIFYMKAFCINFGVKVKIILNSHLSKKSLSSLLLQLSPLILISKSNKKTKEK